MSAMANSETTAPLHIVGLEVSNVKRISAVSIHPDGSLIIIGGKNAQGKSSTLDAIEMALGGAGAIPPDPIRHGARKGRVVVDLGELYPELKNMRLRGRLEGRRVVPYYNRAQIDEGSVAGKEIVWVEDAVELFFLQIQGSGRVKLDSGETIMLGYADQNGYPYRSIGRLLVDRGDLPLERASMQGIKAWARQNPAKLQDLLNYNASYVFFRELSPDLPGPLGALGVPLTARRSIAVDARYIPLGAPVFLATTMPNSRQPLSRLMLAQDTGGAIRGAVRADFFWGFGDEAGALAGRMRQSGKMWVLLPNGYPLPNGN